MVTKLTVSEQQQLSEFRLSFIGNKEDAIHSTAFLSSDYLQSYLTELSSKIGSPSLKVTASIFMKRYAFLAVIGLFTFSRWDKRIDLSPVNVWLETGKQEMLWLPAFSLENANAIEIEEGNREEWRNRIVQELFANHIFPLMEELTKLTNISKLILWENIAVYLFWLYETVLNEVDDKRRKQFIQSDFRFIFHEAKGSLFGEYEQNPLLRFATPKRYIEELGESVRIRNTCCFSYKIGSSMRKCKTCPCHPQSGSCGTGKYICEAD